MPSVETSFKKELNGLLGLNAGSQRPSSVGALRTIRIQVLEYRCRLEETMRVSGTETNEKISRRSREGPKVHP